jgi:hypothetical protein
LGGSYDFIDSGGTSSLRSPAGKPLQTLDPQPLPVHDGDIYPMRSLFIPAILGSLLLATLSFRHQPSTSASLVTQDEKPAPSARLTRNRITVEITGGDRNVPVENASVYLKYIEEHAVKKNKTVELNVKTNEKGVAHIPEPPLGRALVQVIADGWKSYGRWYDITDANQVIKIHLDRPPKWY